MIEYSCGSDEEVKIGGNEDRSKGEFIQILSNAGQGGNDGKHHRIDKQVEAGQFYRVADMIGEEPVLLSIKKIERQRRQHNEHHHHQLCQRDRLQIIDHCKRWEIQVVDDHLFGNDWPDHV